MVKQPPCCFHMLQGGSRAELLLRPEGAERVTVRRLVGDCAVMSADRTVDVRCGCSSVSVPVYSQNVRNDTLMGGFRIWFPIQS